MTDRVIATWTFTIFQREGKGPDDEDAIYTVWRVQDGLTMIEGSAEGDLYAAVVDASREAGVLWDDTTLEDLGDP